LTTKGIKSLHNHVLNLAQIKAGEIADIDEELGLDEEKETDNDKSKTTKTKKSKLPIGDKTLEDYGISW
jgi:hypothetical protein